MEHHSSWRSAEPVDAQFIRSCVIKHHVEVTHTFQFISEGENNGCHEYSVQASLRSRFAHLAAAAAAAAVATPGFAGTTTGGNGNPVTISVSGSTALKNFVTGPGFTSLEPGTTITLSSGSFGSLDPSTGWATYDSNGNQTGGLVTSFQLAPKSLQHRGHEQRRVIKQAYDAAPASQSITSLARSKEFMNWPTIRSARCRYGRNRTSTAIPTTATRSG